MSTFTLFLVFSLLLHNSLATATATATTTPITAMYVFGDSTVDSGNNNHLPTALFHANHDPYGKDYPGRVPTGRFSDGRIATDYIAEWLGLKSFVPAYLDPDVSDRDLLTGVSFASAGSGLDDITVRFSQAIDMTSQVRNFKHALSRMKKTVGRETAAWTVENAMFLISVGTNDMILNYFDLPSRRLQYSISEYSNFLIYRLRPIIQSLYKLGARRFVVAGLPPIGCLPIQVTAGSIFPSTHWLQRVCVDEQNADSCLYNDKLQSLLNSLQSQYPNAKFAYADIYSPLEDMITHPWAFGFQKTVEGCCGTGVVESGDLCNVALMTCPNPSTYVFWDSIHPTQAAHYALAKALEITALPKLLI